jgi:hypothetical protein
MDSTTAAWLEALERRHLADFTVSEVARALRALSSCYVERRSRLAEGGALSSAGKRAAFALFYGPQHFFVVHKIVDVLQAAGTFRGNVPVALVDLGCGTGAAGAAWAVAAGMAAIQGFDRHPWAVDEAAWTYRQFQRRGRTAQRDISRPEVWTANDKGRTASRAVLAAYTVNELAPAGRAALLSMLLDAHRRGDRILIVEPIARRALSWWAEWEEAFLEAGGRTDEWRFPADLPDTTRQLARAAGLDPRELTARSLLV